MTIIQSMQIILTLVVTGVCSILALQFVSVAKEQVEMQKWFAWTLRILLMFHAIAFPAALINLIWSW